MDMGGIRKDSKRFIIISMCNSKKEYVVNVDHDTAELILSNNKQSAKVYYDEDSVHDDIDYLTKYYYSGGYIFTYDNIK